MSRQLLALILGVLRPAAASLLPSLKPPQRTRIDGQFVVGDPAFLTQNPAPIEAPTQSRPRDNLPWPGRAAEQQEQDSDMHTSSYHLRFLTPAFLGNAQQQAQWRIAADQGAAGAVVAGGSIRLSSLDQLDLCLTPTRALSAD